MNDLRLLLHADKDRKIINLQFKQISNLNLLLPLLSKFQFLETLSLNGNRLSTLPLDMSSLSSLNELDISNNLFKEVSDIVESLRTLPRLTHLLYSFKHQAQEQYLLNELPKLERVNKVLRLAPVVAQKKVTKSRAMKLTEKDLEEIAHTYDNVRDIYKKSRYFVDKQLAQQFDRTVESIMSELQTKLQNAQSEEHTNASIIGCKYGLVDLCFTKLITYFYEFDKSVAVILQKIHDYGAEAFKAMNDVLRHSLEKSKVQLAQLSIKKQQLFKTEIKRLKALQQTHLYQISTLESKNAQLLQRLTKNTKQNIFQLTIGSAFKKNQRNMEQSTILDKTQTKALTLNQMKDCMNELYASKQKQNAVCLDMKQPMETLEAHMYTFLNQKYGLKQLTVEWAMSIVNAIKKYGTENAEVGAFGKILKNQLQEQFAQNIKKWKNNLYNNFRRFKGNDESFASILECEEILLNCGMKREQINQMMIRSVDGGMYLNRLEQIVLDYLLKKQSDKVRPLVKMFQSVDQDQDGIINDQQLTQLIHKDNKFIQVSPQSLIQRVDPHGLNRITFSYLCETLLKDPVLKIFFE